MENNIFDQIAKKYDSKKQIELADIIIEEIRPKLQDSKRKTLIDYGSGTGLIGLKLTDLVDTLVLVDSSKQMLELAEEKISRMEIPNANVLCSDFTKETPDFKADIILVSLVLLHIPDTKEILQKLFNVLNNGGELIIIDFDENDKVNHPKVHSGFSHEELKKILSDTGFKSTTINTFYQGSRIFMNQDAEMFIAHSVK